MAGPEGRCGFALDPKDMGVDLDENFRFNDLDDWYKETSAVSCWQKSWGEADTDQCVWHAELAGKSAVDLSDPLTRPERLDGAVLRDAELGDALGFADCSLLGADLSGADLVDADLSGANLSNADLSGADLVDADLSEANLSNADLGWADLVDADLSGADLGWADLSETEAGWGDFSEAVLRGTDLSGAGLQEADFSGADLQEADLSYAFLPRADLSYAFLPRADLSKAHLRGVTLAGVVLGDTNLSTVKLDHRTRFTPHSFELRLKLIFGVRFRKIGFDADAWNAHARDAHTLAATCSEEGLIRQARTLTIWDRQARRNEALSNRSILAAFGSWLNWQTTGYGISVTRVSRNMLFLFLVSTLTYLLYGIHSASEAIAISDLLSTPYLTDPVVNATYFSVVTFTTSPPQPVSVGISQWVAMVETFLGTLLIVLLGYVLGNRERF